MAFSQSLVDTLQKELECSICLNIYTNPKTLPCLHTFCCHCLDELAEKSRENRQQIACPECRTQIVLPRGTTFDVFPTAFYLNRLKDIVSAQRQENDFNCGSCDNKSTVVAFCLNCKCFICVECQQLHSKLKTWKGHRVIALEEIQDVQEILRTPQLCQEQFHDNADLEYFCQTCQQCICQKCTTLTHKNHDLQHLKQAAEHAKSRLKETQTKVQERADLWRQQMNKDNKTHRKVKQQIKDTRQGIQENEQRLIQVVKQHTKKLLTEVEKFEEHQDTKFAQHTDNMELHQAQLNSITEYLNSVSQRGICEEILEAEPAALRRAKEIFDALDKYKALESVFLKFQPDEDVYRQTEHSPLGWVVRVHVTKRRPRGYKAVATFGSPGSGKGQFEFPGGTAVIKGGELAVCDKENHRVQIFTADGQYLREFGTKGNANGKFNCPSGLACNKAGHIVVTDRLNSRIQVFSPTGHRWVSKFGQDVLKRPWGVSVTSDDKIVVCDAEEKTVNVFTQNGVLLLKFVPSPGTQPLYAISVDRKYFVSDSHVIRVFDSRGSHLYDIGQQGNGAGQLYYPRGLAVNTDNLLLVCDGGNHRVQVFTLDGQFVTTFGSHGSRLGQLHFRQDITVLSDGSVFVSDLYNQRIQVFQVQY